MRFCSLWDPEAGRARVCAVEQGELRALAGDAPLVDLVARRGAAGLGGASIELGEAVARWDEVERTEPREDVAHLLPPVRPAEVWAAGVTYERSRDARTLESGLSDVYQRVYAAERPELFVKATGPRVVGPNAPVGLRSDSAWQVPEPELGLVLAQDGAIAGYVLGNDVSSRDIEGENPLYLPQAKIFAGSCALGPVVVSADEIADPYDLTLRLRIGRAGATAYEGATSTGRLHVRLETLTSYLARDNWLAPGTVLLTGTGLVPPDEFALEAGDEIEISCAELGTLRNRCLPAADLAPPDGWGYAGSR